MELQTDRWPEGAHWLDGGEPRAGCQQTDLVEFDDLNDEVGANDWQIPSEELTRRKLIKRTPRYNIYKADWFGDVLLYEPLVAQVGEPVQHRTGCKLSLGERRLAGHGGHRQQVASCPAGWSPSLCGQDELGAGAEPAPDERPAGQFEARFMNELSLNLLPLKQMASSWLAKQQHHHHHHHHHQQQLSPGSTASFGSSVDSAYSSVSSTPQYHTKSSLRAPEVFEFPASDGRLGAAEEAAGATMDVAGADCAEPSDSEHGDTHNDHDDNYNYNNIWLHQDNNKWAQRRCRGRPTVVLNRDSFGARAGGCSCAGLIDAPTAGRAPGPGPAGRNNWTGDTWFELNELRLVAHESFLLFMGLAWPTTMGGQPEAAGHSLVMQMSHPRSVSLFDLVHASGALAAGAARRQVPGGGAIGAGRFFANKHQAGLTLADKLNICQQVTQAMAYLHERNIVHGRLSSANIQLEVNHRVKICLIDMDEPIAAGCAPGHATNGGPLELNLAALTYLSPELIRSLRIEGGPCCGCGCGCGCCCTSTRNGPPCGHTRCQLDTGKLTRESDVYSFGTILFELFLGKFPFQGPSTNCGQHQPAAATHNGSLWAHFTHQTQLNKSDTPLFGTPESNNNNNTEAQHQLARATQFEALIATTTKQPLAGPPPHAPIMAPLTPSPTITTTAFTTGNSFRGTSASELIFQLGSGQIGTKNPRTNTSKCPALVDRIISACWSMDPKLRPQFKQLVFA